MTRAFGAVSTASWSSVRLARISCTMPISAFGDQDDAEQAVAGEPTTRMTTSIVPRIALNRVKTLARTISPYVRLVALAGVVGLAAGDPLGDLRRREPRGRGLELRAHVGDRSRPVRAAGRRPGRALTTLTWRMGDYPSRWESDVVLTDGGTVHLRPVAPDDGDKLQALYSRLSDESLYLRFFSPVPAAHRPAARATVGRRLRPALLARRELGDDIVAIARYDRTGVDATLGRGRVHGPGRPARPRSRDDAPRAPRGDRARAPASTASTPSRCRQPEDAAGLLRRGLRGEAPVRRRDGRGVVPDRARRRSRSRCDARREHQCRGALDRADPRAAHDRGRRREPAAGDDRPRGAAQPARRASSPGPSTRSTRRATSVAGVRAYPSVVDVPDRVDLAVVDRPGRGRPRGGRRLRARGRAGPGRDLRRVRRGRRRRTRTRARARRAWPVGTACA